MPKISKAKIIFILEIIIALVVTGAVCCAGFSNLLFTSNDLYPLTSDAMGHMAKVRYLSEHIFKGEFPSWFPYWYNGSTVAQYYPPLSYWFMVPIFAITKNVMLTFKINCFLMIFTGGMGVWYFCRRYIGRWCGIFGSAVFCLQPYILLTFFGAGLIAQGPVIALTSWYLIALLECFKNPKRINFFFSTLLCTLMILSHPMTIFMICMCMILFFFTFVLLKKIEFHNLVLALISIIFAGILTALWSFIGVTQFETPGIPYLLVEAALNYTASIDWYITLKSSFFFFAIPVSVLSILGILTFAYRKSRKEASKNENYYIFCCVILTIFTVIFSFGLNLPLFKYIPFAESFVPGRILGLTSVTAAVLCAYFIYIIIAKSKGKNILFKSTAFFASMLTISLLFFYMNPFILNYRTIGGQDFDEMISKNMQTGNNFEKGRYSSIGPVDSSETYFPISYGYNTTSGWNIEGTPHNQSLWAESTAFSTDRVDYIAKNLAYWNVRSLYLNGKFESVVKELSQKYKFKENSNTSERKFYFSEAPSSYFLEDPRNALILGIGAPGVAMEFPNLVYEQRENIWDYSIDELKKYKFIYICEPKIESEIQKEKFENKVEELVGMGITVIIEPTVTKAFSIFNVLTCDVQLEELAIMQQKNDFSDSDKKNEISIDKKINYARVLYGLDKVDYKLIQNNGELENDIIGTKKIESGEVVFIGMHLSQFLKPVYARNWGVPENGKYPDCAPEVELLFEKIFKSHGVNSDFWPEPFPISNEKWDYKGVDFDYTSQEEKDVTISVTYTPRWKAVIDGKTLEVQQKENLININLPPGSHNVKLTYGVTNYGIAGYVISIVGFILFVLFLKFYDIILFKIKNACLNLKKLLQM